MDSFILWFTSYVPISLAFVSWFYAFYGIHRIGKILPVKFEYVRCIKPLLATLILSILYVILSIEWIGENLGNVVGQDVNVGWALWEAGVICFLIHHTKFYIKHIEKNNR